jgi:hypothetical protein
LSTSIVDFANFGLIAVIDFIAVIGLDRQFHWPQAHCCQRLQPAISLASSPLLSSALAGNFFGFKPVAVFGLDRQFPWPQAQTLSSALTGNFLGLKPIAVFGLDRQFPPPQAHCCHWP